MQNNQDKAFQQEKQYWAQWDALPAKSSSLWKLYRSQHPAFQLGYCGCLVTFALIFFALFSFGTMMWTIPQMTAYQSTGLATIKMPTPTMAVVTTTQERITTARTSHHTHPTPAPTPKHPVPTPQVRSKLKKH